MLFLLSVVSIRTMLAAEMFLYQQGIHRQMRIDGICNACHFATCSITTAL